MPDSGYFSFYSNDADPPIIVLDKDVTNDRINEITYGKHLFLELFEPIKTINNDPIIINQINYIFFNSFKKKEKSSETGENINLKSGGHGTAVNQCQRNVVCTDVQVWAKESRSIVFIDLVSTMNGITIFAKGTGFFINKSTNYSDTNEPYLLTCGHIFSPWINNVNYDLTTDPSLISKYYVNYRDETCTGDTKKRTGQLLPGSMRIVQKGYSYNINSFDPTYEENGDYILLQPNRSVLNLKKYNILYAGWTGSTLNNYDNGYAAIGHPHGDVQKVLVENQNATIAGNGRYIAFYFDKGVNEAGFSGSPTFNASKKIVGWICKGEGTCLTMGQNIDMSTCGRFDQIYFNIASYIDPTNLNEANDSEPSPPVVSLPAHCTNCTQDADETGRDCGGSCLPCGMQDVFTIRTQSDVTKSNLEARYELVTEPDAGTRFEYVSGNFNLTAGHGVIFKNNVLIKSGVNLKVAAIPELLSEPPRGCQAYCLSAANIFTPNGDGINDYWSFNQSFLKSYSLSVKDRWGIVKFTKSTTAIEENGTIRAWDGTGVSGNGNYYVLFSFTDCLGVTRNANYVVYVSGITALNSEDIQEEPNTLPTNENENDEGFKVLTSTKTSLK
jgi:gliding motility-associated-like protein